MKAMLRKSLLLLLTLAVALSVYFPKTYSAQFSPQDRAVAFIREVLLIDIDKYNVTYSGPSIKNPPNIENVTEIYGVVRLQSDTGTIEVLYEFADGNLNFCVVYMRDTSPKYTQQMPNNLRDKILLFLDKYQVFSGDPTLQQMMNMVENADLTRDSATFTDNLRFGVQIDSSTTAVGWQNILDGAGYSSFHLSFYTGDNGTLNSLVDDRSYVKIGGGRVNVSKDQAVQIALSNAQSPSWGSVVKDQIRVALLTKGRDVSWVWYPYWIVYLPLRGDYDVQTHGGVIAVEIWADTAQVNRIYLGTGGGGELYNATTPSPIPNITPTQNPIDDPITASPTSSPPILTPSPSPSPSPTQQPTPAPTISPTHGLTFAPSPSPTQQPTSEPSQTAQPTTPPEKYASPMPYLILGSILIALTIAGLTVYFTKFRKKATVN